MSLLLEPLSSATTAEVPDVFPPASEALMDPAAPVQVPNRASTPSAAPREPSAEERIWSSRKRRLARSAVRAALVVPGIVSADCTIMGTPERPSLMFAYVLRPDANAPRIVEHIENTVVGDLELLLGAPFVARQVEFSVGRG
ncbi:hypothetical protein [Citricoccus sp. CH26A]|uniref:hypothetical protein n=1 Tax=Citricoccus TaxID=169133 RepID=UPI001145B10A|nr:hypothetical protein [Citricoccus sp. CH26A]